MLDWTSTEHSSAHRMAHIKPQLKSLSTSVNLCHVIDHPHDVALIAPGRLKTRLCQQNMSRIPLQPWFDTLLSHGFVFTGNEVHMLSLRMCHHGHAGEEVTKDAR